MTERPIIFTAESVREILAGRKTQTRRLLNPQPNVGVVRNGRSPSGYDHVSRCGSSLAIHVRPQFGVGQRLWVRETWSISGNGPYYRADVKQPETVKYAWRSPIFMPRWASRITLEITAVRIERLREITEADAVAEGVGHYDCGHPDCDTPRERYAAAWDRINRKRAAWSTSPFVWVVTFRKLEPR